MALDTETSGRPSPAAPDASAPAIELRGISKSFGPVQANKDISIRVMPGTIHGIIGENGAGKSTLMSILYGFYKADAGEIFINGRKTEIPDSQAAIRAGIGMVFQHFKLVENFTVLENVILGVEDGPMLRPSLAKARSSLKSLAEEYELNVDPDAVIENLSVGHQQRVEILKALYRQAQILILDEPTGVLTPAEADQLFRILARLKEEGKTIVLITHKLREIMDTTDTVSVMRRGEMTATVTTASTSPEELAELMVGRKVLLRIDKKPATPGRRVLEVEDLRVVDSAGVERLKGVSLHVAAGEILGIAGVAGNGQTELLEVPGGIQTGTGTVRINGEEIHLSGKYSDARTRRHRVSPMWLEDRQREGLIMDFFAWENACFGYHDDPAYNRGPSDRQLTRSAAMPRRRSRNHDIRPANCWQTAKNFSGGNQQKLVVAPRRWSGDPELLLVGQPTRGVDIAAIEFIHRQIIALRDAGRGSCSSPSSSTRSCRCPTASRSMFDGRIIGRTPAVGNR